MKYFMLFCGGMVDEPLEELGGKTPLEAAKTPFMDLLSSRGRVGMASFLPRALPAQADVACMSILGYDPLRYYTGIAPLEAMSFGIAQSDHEIAFRCDFVTEMDKVLVDAFAGGISTRESRFLVGELNSKLSGADLTFWNGNGYKNFLLVQDAGALDDLDEVECLPPRAFVGQEVARHLPRGKRSDILTDLVKRSKAVLEDHEINRVRIDLKENPANMIWPWGQGKKPKMPAFAERHGIRGGVVSDADFANGLAKVLQMKLFQNMSAAFEEVDLVFVYQPSPETPEDLASKIRRIEMFDAQVVGPVLKKAEKSKGCRICIGTDAARPLSQGTLIHGAVPVLVVGKDRSDGPSAGQLTEAFHERAAEESRWRVDEGCRFMEWFLK